MKKLAFILFSGLAMSLSANVVKGKYCGSWTGSNGQLYVCCNGGTGVCVAIVVTADVNPHTTLTTYNDGNIESVRDVYECKNVTVNEDAYGATVVADLLD